MEEWLKFHTYIVCNTKRSAKCRMFEDYWYYCRRFGWEDYIKMNRSQLTIESKFRVRQYLSMRQVLSWFDGVDNVDRFELDDTLSDEKANDIIRVVDVLKRSGVLKFERLKRREEYHTDIKERE